MEATKMRSRRRSATVGVTPIKDALISSAAKKVGMKKASRKVLADKTNSTPVSGLVPAATKSEKREGAEEHREASSPCMRGEDVLRSQVHKELTMAVTPANGLSACNVYAVTPQFRIPLAPYEDEDVVPAPCVESPEAASPSNQKDVPAPAETTSSAVTVLDHSAEWVGRDVDEVALCGDDDFSDCSVVVNVSSPAVAQFGVSTTNAYSMVSPNPGAFSARWQQRASPLKVKIADDQDDHYDNDAEDDYEGCDEYDEQEDYDQDCEELCHGISRISVAEHAGGLPEHKGRHVRFNYNSKDEIEEEEVVRLRGLPTPRGKHLRFPEASEESEVGAVLTPFSDDNSSI